jgi:predicted enzyme related to lactoylglutathione lyase
MGSCIPLIEPSLGLIVLRAADLGTTLRFYETIGLSFIQEQHGSGPVHYSCELGGTVVEIYPGQMGKAPDRKTGGAVMLGFRVGSLNSVVDAIKGIGGLILTNPQSSPWGKRAVVEDPDGRAVELNEPNSGI